MKYIIPRAKSGKEKQMTYAKYIAQYNKAVRNEFYLEAIMIDYAMMEDRLVAILHYLGVVTRTHEKLGVNKFCRADVRCLLGYKENAAVGIQNISVKIKLLEKLMHITEEEQSSFISAIILHIDNCANRSDVLTLCKELAQWCETRNQYVHALLNKNYDSLQNGLMQFATKGYGLARQIDNIVKVVKKNNTIRKKFRIQ